MSDREALIFAPTSKPPHEWYFEILGEVIKPAVRTNQMDWFWFGCYPERWGQGCDAEQVPLPKENFAWNGLQRFAKLRYRVQDERTLESDLCRLANSIGCHAHFAVYDLVLDLGTARFLAPVHDASVSNATRADTVVRFLHASSLLALDCLYCPNGRWVIEQNTNNQNPTELVYDSLTHLGYNMVGVWAGFAGQPGISFYRLP